MENEIKNKYILYAEIKPYDLKFTLVFHKNQKICHIQEFVDDTMRNFRTRYKIGRIESKKSGSVLLPDYNIGEVLENKDEIVIYSVDYGLTKKTLPKNTEIEDIDKCYISKKTKRDGKSLNESGFNFGNNFKNKNNFQKNKKMKENGKLKGKDKLKEKVNEKKSESAEEENDEDESSKQKESSSSDNKEEKSDEKKNKKESDSDDNNSNDKDDEDKKKKSSENDSDSDSGDDKEDDIKL